MNWKCSLGIHNKRIKSSGQKKLSEKWDLRFFQAFTLSIVAVACGGLPYLFNVASGEERYPSLEGLFAVLAAYSAIFMLCAWQWDWITRRRDYICLDCGIHKLNHTKLKIQQKQIKDREDRQKAINGKKAADYASWCAAREKELEGDYFEAERRMWEAHGYQEW